MMLGAEYEAFFQRVMGDVPHSWQRETPSPEPARIDRDHPLARGGDGAATMAEHEECAITSVSESAPSSESTAPPQTPETHEEKN